MADEPGGPIARRDEVLQLLYWIEGEGLTGSATLAGLVRFLAYAEDAEDEVRLTLADLTVRGDVRQDAESGEYRLTDAGRHEAARRFIDEFAPLLGQGHGECHDPDCECHRDPASAAECHATRAGRPPAV